MAHRPPCQIFQPIDGRMQATTIDSSMEHRGRIVKITVIGCPGQVVERQGVMVLTMRQANVPPLPKGMSDLPPRPTNYLVFIATKQWRTVADSITNPEDVLIIEGYPTQHPQFAGSTVYATAATTKRQQQAKGTSRKWHVFPSIYVMSRGRA